jgi:hypothetical protein
MDLILVKIFAAALALSEVSPIVGPRRQSRVSSG